MTRRHFEAIAAVLQGRIDAATADELGELFATFNPNFQPTRWLEAVMEEREAA